MKLIPHSKPSINAKDIRAAGLVLQSGALSQGRKVAEFEAKVSRYLGLRSGVAVNSGTSALHLALLALKVGPRDEVIIPSYVCTALLNAVAYTGAKARIVDVKEDDFNISPLGVKRALNKKVKVIIVPHMFGFSADLKELLKLGVPLIEDCAQSIGADYESKKLGSWGALSVCSFYATKVMTTGEGGMVLSNQAKLLDRIRDLRQYDHAIDFQTRYNYKMTDFQAALGINQLQRLPEIIKERRSIARTYDQIFLKAGLTIPCKSSYSVPIYYRYVIKVKQNAGTLIEQFNKKGIGVRSPVFKPLHRYIKSSPCPVADRLMDQAVSIPIYPDLTEAQINQIRRSYP